MIHDQVKSRRGALGMSRTAFAEAMGVDWVTVWRWEERQQAFSTTTLLKIARVLQTTPEALVGDSQSPALVGQLAGEI